tara:strand:- start:904 stop:1182 length:279 start_codon:yes stop_codon:yes gene_type:complete
MGFKCYFCEERDRVSYFSNWCKECAMLRRWLLTYSPDKCTDILKRTLIRDEKQINYKIQQEVKKVVLQDIIKPSSDKSDDSSYLIKTRSKTN